MDSRPSIQTRVLKTSVSDKTFVLIGYVGAAELRFQLTRDEACKLYLQLRKHIAELSY